MVCFVSRENEVLWREVASLRQMHMKQQHIVSKVKCLLPTLTMSVGMGRAFAVCFSTA